MRSRGSRRPVPAAIIGIVLLLALPTLPGAAPSERSAPRGAGPGPVELPGRIVVAPAYHPPAGARDAGPVPGATETTVLVGLGSRDPVGFDARTEAAMAPGSVLYRQFLTPSQIAASYGASPTTVAAARAYFEAAGLSARVSPDGLLLTVSGPAGRIGPAFGTTLERYEVGHRLVFAHARAASLPAGVPWRGVLGLGDTTPIVPSVRAVAPVQVPRPAAGVCPLGEPFFPCEISRAYNTSSLLAAGTNGSGYRIAVVDAYDSSESQTDLQRDLAGFESLVGLPAGNVSYVYPVPTSTNLNSSPASGWGTEEALDIEWARASAPGASEAMVLAPNASVALYYAVDWVVAHHAADAMSLSWGEPDVGVYNAYAGACPWQCNATTDGSYTLLHPVLEAAAAEGIGVFAASDDCGASGGTSGLSTEYPASDPFVTGVGGSVLSVDASTGNYASEVAWSGNTSGSVSPGCVNQGGSGGGFSPYPRPAWQRAPGLSTSTPGRGVPDIAMIGGSAVVTFLGNSTSAAAGTSEGSPIWAGSELLGDQLAGAPLGSLDPSLYQLARSGSPGTYFHDITSGNNGYPAGTGWDPVTGIGSPIFDRLLAAVGATPPASDGLRVDLFGAPRLGPAPLTTAFRIAPSGGSAPYPFVDIGFGDGNASLLPGSTLSVNHTYARAGVYPATVTLVDSRGNSSTAPPLPVVVGGGNALAVGLNLSTASPGIGQSIWLNASAANGSGPYRYSYYFGDGTYLVGTARSSVRHPYGFGGGFCAAVVATDAGRPTSGGSSPRIPVTVGGAAAPVCPSASPLTANLTSGVAARDLPGDLPLTVATTGGTLPVSVDYATDDPYVRACDCGIFTVPGNHTVRAFVNDSLDQQTQATLAVELHPALALEASASALTGPAPWTVNFSAALSGGYRNATPSLAWSFGDGATLGGSVPSPSHTYSRPGVYTAWVVASDSGGGTAGQVWVVNATAGGGSSLRVGVTILNGTATPAGRTVRFLANASGGAPPYRVAWDLGDNDSAFGADVNQTYTGPGCLAAGTCPLRVRVTVRDSAGASWATTVRVPGAIVLRASGATFSDTGPIPDGSTPYRISVGATATGVQGLSVGWAFGDGATATGPSEVHTYYAPGNYTVVETATDPFGDRLVRTHAFVVTGPTFPPLVANASAVPSEGIGPLSVRFNASAAGGVGAPYTVAWTFGDGGSDTVAVGIPADHVYGAAGNFSALATISDVRGDRVVLPLNVSVYSLTLVGLAVQASDRTVTTAATLELSVALAAGCLPTSVPGCANGSVPVEVRIGPPGAGNFSQSYRVAGPLLANDAGDLGVTVGPFANASGPRWLWVDALGPNYTGVAHVAITVVGVPVPCGACGASSFLGLGPEATLDLLLGAATAAVAVAAVLLWRRRPGAPAEPGPAVPDGPTPPAPPLSP